MVYKATYQIDGTKRYDIVNALKKAGFSQTPTRQTIPSEEIREIVSTLPSSDQRKLINGTARMVTTGRSEFRNGQDIISIDDFDIKEVERVRSDPYIFVYELVKGRTSYIVKEIVEETVTVDIIKAALISVTSRKFKTSVKDLARITGENPNVVYNRCINTLVKSCVSGFKRIDVREEDMMPTRTMRKIPVRTV